MKTHEYPTSTRSYAASFQAQTAYLWRYRATNNHAIEVQPSQEDKGVTATLQGGCLHITWDSSQAIIRFAVPC